MKRYVATLLLPLLISSWLGMATWEDDPSGSRIDLEDAVLCVKDFARAAENPPTFTISIHKLVSTMRVLAGLKAVIKPATDTQPASTSSSLNLPYLISSYDVSASSNIWSEVPETVFCQ